jgi:tRNA(Arg) A34 adenosine deaminase TadA
VDATDETHLRRAIALAHTARAAGQHPYGSLLVSASGEVIADGYNTELADGDITAHPELKLARWAARHLGAGEARATTMYTSCEPCPLCRAAIASSGLGRVVFALGSQQWEAITPPGAGAVEAVAYDGPALFDEARAPIDGYYG